MVNTFEISCLIVGAPSGPFVIVVSSEDTVPGLKDLIHIHKAEDFMDPDNIELWLALVGGRRMKLCSESRLNEIFPDAYVLFQNDDQDEIRLMADAAVYKTRINVQNMYALWVP
ncbi:hypothetical protein BGZ58_001836 [Dissophora ornata]|nr:hypothetical protein BGZ58_001836 [Dissophora ornata]